MPGVREFLLRLRPAGAPGQAAAAGVPADLKARASEELDPVFAALRSALLECERLRSEAQTQAAATVSAANERARTIRGQADGAAAAERARVAAGLMARADAEVTELAEQARAEAVEVQRAAAGAQDARIAQVLAHVRQQLSALDGEGG
jgi:hypothetical protein